MNFDDPHRVCSDDLPMSKVFAVGARPFPEDIVGIEPTLRAARKLRGSLLRQDPSMDYEIYPVLIHITRRPVG